MWTNVINFLLFPVYQAYLTPTDYGHYALLILFSTVAKIVFRLGLDAGFFRIYYEMRTEADRRRLAGTVTAFSALVAILLFSLIVLGAGPLTRAVLGAEAPSRWWVVLTAADVFAGTFSFVPQTVLRVQDRPATFSALNAGRETLRIVLKVWLVTGGWGVPGILWSDVIASVVFSACLLPVLFRHARPAFDRRLLQDVLAFALPKVPHGFLVQVLNLADRKILDLFVPRAVVGLYQVGYTLGTAPKFAMSAFEPAWSPFVYSQIQRAGARATLARVVTYVFAAFVFATLGVALLGGEILTVMTPNNHAFRAAAPVIPVVALAYLLHGVFLLTSIGIGIEKKARYYPLVTGAAAATNVAANFLLIPSQGMMGAAWATVLSYAVMAALGFWFSHRLFPIPFDAGHWLQAAAAAAAIYALSALAPSSFLPRVAFELALVASYPLVLMATGFLRAPGAADAEV